jgi:hypothetical protein
MSASAPGARRTRSDVSVVTDTGASFGGARAAASRATRTAVSVASSQASSKRNTVGYPALTATSGATPGRKPTRLACTR